MSCFHFNIQRERTTCAWTSSVCTRANFPRSSPQSRFSGSRGMRPPTLLSFAKIISKDCQFTHQRGVSSLVHFYLGGVFFLLYLFLIILLEIISVQINSCNLRLGISLYQCLLPQKNLNVENHIDFLCLYFLILKKKLPTSV